MFVCIRSSSVKLSFHHSNGIYVVVLLSCPIFIGFTIIIIICVVIWLKGSIRKGKKKRKKKYPSTTWTPKEWRTKKETFHNSHSLSVDIFFSMAFGHSVLQYSLAGSCFSCKMNEIEFSMHRNWNWIRRDRKKKKEEIWPKEDANIIKNTKAKGNVGSSNWKKIECYDRDSFKIGLKLVLSIPFFFLSFSIFINSVFSSLHHAGCIRYVWLPLWFLHLLLLLPLHFFCFARWTDVFRLK